MKKTIATVQQELAHVKKECGAAEKNIAILNKKLEKEEQRVEKEIERCRREADVIREEVATAGRVKQEAESHGFTLESMLDLAKEFGGHKNARKELSGGLKKHGSLIKYVNDLEDWSNKEQTRITGEIESLASKKKGLTDETVHLAMPPQRIPLPILELKIV